WLRSSARRSGADGSASLFALAAGAACVPVGAVFEDVAGAFGAAFDAALAAAAPLAAATSWASPVVPGAAGSGASAAGLGRSTVNHTADMASMATRAMRKGRLIWLTANPSDAAPGT